MKPTFLPAVTWVRTGDRAGQEHLVPELGSSRAAPSRQGCWDSPASLAPGPFCRWIETPTGIPGDQQDVLRGCLMGTTKEAPPKRVVWWKALQRCWWL